MRVVSLPLLPEALNAAVPARQDECCTEGLAVNLQRAHYCLASIAIIFLFAWLTPLVNRGRGQRFLARKATAAS